MGLTTVQRYCAACDIAYEVTTLRPAEFVPFFAAILAVIFSAFSLRVFTALYHCLYVWYIVDTRAMHHLTLSCSDDGAYYGRRQ